MLNANAIRINLKYMDFERGTEFGMKEAPTRESGYSEEEMAKIIEGSTQDVKQTPSASSGQVGNKRKPLPSGKSRKEKIISAYKINLEK